MTKSNPQSEEEDYTSITSQEAGFTGGNLRSQLATIRLYQMTPQYIGENYYYTIVSFLNIWQHVAKDSDDRLEYSPLVYVFLVP